MDSLDFRSGNLDATEAFLSSAYTPMRIGGSVSDARVRISRRAMGSLSVDRLVLGYDMRYDAGSLGKVCLISMHAGTLVDRTGGRETVFGPGETFLLAQPDLPYQGEVRAARYTIAMFDTVLLDRMAVAGGTAGPGPVRLTAPRATTADGNDRLTAAVLYLRDAVLNDAGSSPGALVVSTAAHHLAAAVLSALPHTARTAPARVDTRDAGSGTLRRAVAFIDDNAHRDLTLADIATAARVTPRALQYAFRRHAGTTPLGHLRRVRLERAHADLAAADPCDGATVTEIAMRWGFAHPGRFADMYRRAYGRAPSLTLHGDRTGRR
ncbi:AraC family transcriptional regulator [Streptomyces sp. BE20]|uniref:helix-turn-helix transcriptional regulator n=1 Tax=unclassified Streptomyces TaxID=2593676 RepID=UPI002E799AC7|nr:MULTISPECIES: AraC family transcriptional regulator [unclassified Streptomyces]MED7951535.1 AraC family transcriptional regulator [Streptomyces sp. BE303]MEE1827616.1 AraC family transcriptional regulator [Streptomyces sp. BE20]